MINKEWKKRKKYDYGLKIGTIFAKHTSNSGK